MKRLFDVAAAAVLLVLLSPVLLVAALAVRVTLGAPVFFRDRRAGRHSAPFDLLKLRTMRHRRAGEEGPAHDAARLTRIGRCLRATSIDELPSLINVLRGDMSLVGPRPLPVHYLPRYTPEQIRRHEIRPGVTGWAVVHGRNGLSWTERLALDVWYVDHQSLVLDAQILWRTVGLVLNRRGVDHADGVTMTEFTGSES